MINRLHDDSINWIFAIRLQTFILNLLQSGNLSINIPIEERHDGISLSIIDHGCWRHWGLCKSRLNLIQLRINWSLVQRNQWSRFFRMSVIEANFENLAQRVLRKCPLQCTLFDMSRKLATSCAMAEKDKWWIDSFGHKLSIWLDKDLRDLKLYRLSVPQQIEEYF